MEQSLKSQIKKKKLLGIGSPQQILPVKITQVQQNKDQLNAYHHNPKVEKRMMNFLWVYSTNVTLCWI